MVKIVVNSKNKLTPKPLNTKSGSSYIAIGVPVIDAVANKVLSVDAEGKVVQANIFAVSNRIGIGRTPTTDPLEVEGYLSSWGTAGAGFKFERYEGDDVFHRIESVADGIAINTGGGTKISLYPAGMRTLTALYTGSYGAIGVGTDSPLARHHIVAGDNVSVANIIQGVTGQTGNLSEWWDSTSTLLTKVTSDGRVSVNTAIATASLNVVPKTPSTIGQIIQAAVGQLSNLVELRDSAGVVRTYITKDFALRVGHPSVSTRYLNVGWGSIYPNSASDEFGLYNDGAAKAGMILYGSNTFPTTNRNYVAMRGAGWSLKESGYQIAHASALFELIATDKGFLPPRMTGAQVESISSPAEGLLVYATDAGTGDVTGKGWWGWNGSNWEKP